MQEDAFGGNFDLPDSDDSDSDDDALDWGEEGLFGDPSYWGQDGGKGAFIKQEGGGKGSLNASGKRKHGDRGKEIIHKGRPGRPKGDLSGGKLKKPASSITK